MRIQVFRANNESDPKAEWVTSVAYFVFPEWVFQPEGQGNKYSCFIDSGIPVAVELDIFVVVVIADICL